MSNSQVIINGPGPVGLAYGTETASLDNNTPFELADGRWGIKLCSGAVVFSREDDGEHLRSSALSINSLLNLDSVRLCRELPGKVDITYLA